MKKTKKAFDCVEMMHEGGARIHEVLKDMTREGQLAYGERRTKRSARSIRGCANWNP